MVSCKHCATPNSLDSTFCKKCGTPLPDDDLKLAAVKLDELTAQGVALFNAGKVEEAMDVAETAASSNPSSVAALALKGDCHAHRGEISEAIECYETIVSLNPESTLDKIRLNQLRNSLVLTARAVPDRKLAIVGAVAAVVLVASLSALIARSRTPSLPSEEIIASAQEPQSPAEKGEWFGDADTQQPQTPANPQATQPQQPQNQAPQAQQPPRSQEDRTDIPLPKAPREVLPGPSESEIPEIEVRPVRPNLPNGIIGGNGNNGSTATPPNPTLPAPRKGVDEDPSVDRTMAGNKPQADDPGQIEIEVRRGAKGAPGTTSTVGSATGVEALTRVARDQYQLGNYAGAANAYEKALNSGGDPVSINQRLGQAYERLGRNGDAAAAYQRALSSAESAIASGKGNKDRLQAIADSCKQALRVLGN